MPGARDQSTRSAFETPAKRTRMKAKSPAHREWKSMRQRVLSLTQQVAALKSTKETLTKSLTEQKFSNEKLQNDLNQSQQRAKISKQTIEVTKKQTSVCGWCMRCLSTLPVTGLDSCSYLIKISPL